MAGILHVTYSESWLLLLGWWDDDRSSLAHDRSRAPPAAAVSGLERNSPDTSKPKRLARCLLEFGEVSVYEKSSKCLCQLFCEVPGPTTFKGPKKTRLFGVIGALVDWIVVALMSFNRYVRAVET
ncbi:hypothetical protein LX32DRAFT_646455 [Colletotrichum zoysiae]|uniref:Uncharacterized protein n=1 Tax=Colletotrichum zoysiae TaxID=1216348 RepID=A0AAD9H3H2_9PEZI|nr:hypothetical protein LX32DRAFT_646455 [Colletotrichum zoysiae]